MTPGTRVFPTRSNPNWLFAAERARAGVVGNTGSLGRLYSAETAETDAETAETAALHLRSSQIVSKSIISAVFLSGFPDGTEFQDLPARSRVQLPQMVLGAPTNGFEIRAISRPCFYPSRLSKRDLGRTKVPRDALDAVARRL